MLSRLPHIKPRTVAQWTRGVALLLVGAMLMQGVPFHALMGHDAEPCPCAQRGYCPHSPDGETCTCEHHAHGSEGHAIADAAATHHDGASLQSCGEMQPDTPAVMVLLKAFLHPSDGLSLPAQAPEPQSIVTALATQRISTDIFHPPKRRIG
jgi:hypothetical protein